MYEELRAQLIWIYLLNLIAIAPIHMQYGSQNKIGNRLLVTTALPTDLALKCDI